ncbi:hypothetical protein B0H14DRAFT_2578407 [Mycena olivaceomarginata]|nr:hypothetical protein B0H14DRAFT_2578407 [Mycena olivaceomarginata]
MSKQRVRIYTAEDVSAHKSQSNCWLSHRGKVYNVSKFVNDHPGGDDIILKYAGKDVSGVMAGKEGESHEHSDSAYDMLDEYQIGRLGTEESIVRDDWEAPDDFHPEETDSAEDYKKNEFLDLSKPLIRQVWEGHFSKSYYLQQVHQPRHLPESARLLGLIFSRSVSPSCPDAHVLVGYPSPLGPHHGVPLLPLPHPISLPPGVALPLFTARPALPLALLSSALTSQNLAKVFACFLTGNVIWTILEYTLHRFLFHIDDLLPDHPLAILVHFAMHGVHHYLPMDRLRLVMPPTLFGALQAPFTALAHKLFPAAVANGIISGAFAFYILYDCMHYALHHTQLPAYLREQKRYHLAHHYKNFELGFGVTSKFWDYVFNTQLSLRPL